MEKRIFLKMSPVLLLLLALALPQSQGLTGLPWKAAPPMNCEVSGAVQLLMFL